jgi:hypothetical protein
MGTPLKINMNIKGKYNASFYGLGLYDTIHIAELEVTLWKKA